LEIPDVVARQLANYFGADEYDYASEIVATRARQRSNMTRK
jgi:hypothetical protein